MGKETPSVVLLVFCLPTFISSMPLETSVITTVPPMTIADTYCMLASPCQNGGTCLDQNYGPGYVCKCTEHYKGLNCEEAVTTTPVTTTPTTTFIVYDTYCMLMDPCQNGGTCKDRNGGGYYYCDCLPSYTGENCEQYLMKK